MLLQRLVAYQHDSDSAEGPAFFRRRLMRWRVSLAADGTLRDTKLVDLADPADRATKNGREFPVPHITRTVGIAPCLGADDLQYVLGWADEASRPERVAKAHEAFVELVHSWAKADPDERVAAAFVGFYAGDEARRLVRPDGWLSKHGVLVTVDGLPATESPSLQRFWAAEVQRRKTGAAKSGGGRRGICLVCGQIRGLLDTLPQKLPERLIPGATNDASLVSANKPIHAYDFTDGLSTVPVCLDCGRQAVDGLRKVLEDPRHSLTYGGQHARLVWWTIGPEIDVSEMLADEQPATVDGLVLRVHHGDLVVDELEPDRFCALTLSGNVARVAIHDWIDMPLGALERNIGRWFADHRTEGSGRQVRPYFPLLRLVSATGRWVKSSTGGSGRYAPLGDKAAQRPPDVAQQLLRAALLGTTPLPSPLPSSLLGHLITRIRTDQRVDGPRAALLRLILVRYPNRAQEAPMPGLDPDDLTPSYLAGRLFATYESIQYATTRASGQDRLNTTFADRYLAGAITNPRGALIQGQQLSSAWLKKLARSRPGPANALSRRLTALVNKFNASDGLPSRADMHSQALFILGYHHQRASDFAAADAANARRSAADSEADSDADDIAVAALPAD